MKKNTGKTLALGLAIGVMFLGSCSTANQHQKTISGLNPADFDTIIGGKQVKLFTLTNGHGMEVCMTNFGGRVVSITVPDKNGKPTDVVLGYDNIRQYADTKHSPSDFGATIGRYANRIDHGKLPVAGKIYQLPINDNGHCLHGGPTGWQYQVYDARQVGDSSLVLTLTSPDGDNGFPGEVKAEAIYTVKYNNTLDCQFTATSDRETVINMTNHSYFNLNGDPSKDGMDMWLYLNADNYTPSDPTYMTTGDIKSVQGTPMDFRSPHAINQTIGDTTFDQIRNATGYDHNWCLNTYKDGKGDDTKVAAWLFSPRTGIMLEMFTNEPGVQVYTANFQGTGISCKHGIKYPKHVSVCLESQKYPDSPNKFTKKVKGWPSPYLIPGQKYYSHLAFRFSVMSKM